MTESLLQDRIRLILGADSAGCWWRNNVGVAQSSSGHTIRYGLSNGSADLIGVFRGRFVAVEVKTPTGKQSADQVRWQSLIESKLGIYAIVRSEDDARSLLQDLHRRYPA